MVKVVFLDHQGGKHLVEESEAKESIRCYGVYIKDGKILLVKDPRSGSKQWELPGGGVEQKETPEQGLIREFKEETGLNVGKFDFMFQVHEDYYSLAYKEAMSADRRYYFVKEADGDLIKEGNGWDTDVVEFIDLKELKNLRVQEAQMPAIQKAIEIYKSN